MRLREDTVAQATQSLIPKSITVHMTTQQQDATEGTGPESIQEAGFFSHRGPCHINTVS